jgi:hypothetical protein
MQFVPFPAIMPLKPSSRQIFASALEMLILYSVRPEDCTCNRIFNRSKGETTVRDTAPATPPPMNEATTPCDTHILRLCIVVAVLGCDVGAESCDVEDCSGGEPAAPVECELLSASRKELSVAADWS